MEEKEVKAPNSEKLSYEQLENVAHQLSEQNRQLYAKLQELQVDNMFKRLDYLFKVVENNNGVVQSFDGLDCVMLFPGGAQNVLTLQFSIMPSISFA